MGEGTYLFSNQSAVLEPTEFQNLTQLCQYSASKRSALWNLVTNMNSNNHGSLVPCRTQDRALLTSLFQLRCFGEMLQCTIQNIWIFMHLSLLVLEDLALPKMGSTFWLKNESYQHFSAVDIWSHDSQTFFVYKGAVYIQIIRSSKSLCAITEAHDVVRKYWILWKMSGSWYLWLGTKISLCFFCTCFEISFFFVNHYPHIWHINALNIFYTCRQPLGQQNLCGGVGWRHTKKL